MRKRILVTDSLFIADSHVRQMEAAGFSIERLDKVAATEEELVAAIGGVHGYILGGVERVTRPVIAAASQLEAICFTGSGYTEFIPAYEYATQKGIAIATAAGANALDVAEFTVGLMIEMVRNFPLLRTRNESKNAEFFTARRLHGLTLGVVGFGRIGSRVASLAQGFGVNILVHSRSDSLVLPHGMRASGLAELLSNCDVVTVHVDKAHGHHVLGANEIALLKPGAIVLNAAFPEAVDVQALLTRVRAKEIRAAFDAAPEADLAGLEVGYFAYSNAQTAFNTVEAISETSDRVTRSMINLLSRGDDTDVVNGIVRRH